MKLQVFAPSTIVACFLAIASLGGGTPSEQTANRPMAQPAIAVINPYLQPQETADLDVQRPVADSIWDTAMAEPETLPSDMIFTQTLEKTLTVARGDTLGRMFRKADIDSETATQVVQALRAHFDPRHLREGQEVRIGYTETPSGRLLNRVSLSPKVHRTIVVDGIAEGDYAVREIDRPLKTKLVAARNEIASSLFAAGGEAGVPMAVMSGLIKLYSWDIDFQRDIQPGDRFELLYETAVSDTGAVVRTGVIQYALLTVNGKEHAVYRYTDRDGNSGYYGPDGDSIQKALLRTPIDGGRVSSPFGMRRHPILGYSKMHKGIDFAVPTGTPIYAAGDGVVDRIGWNGGYGRYIRIRHNDKISTAYAHLSRFAKGLRRGDRVSQQQIIGYVGSSGRSTGPHLHYEVLMNGNQVNPSSLDLPTGRTLTGRELQAFQAMVEDLQQQFRSLQPKTRMAALDPALAGDSPTVQPE